MASNFLAIPWSFSVLGALTEQKEIAMPTFDTPEPISVTVEIGVGDIRIVASDRTDTVVEVRPSDEAKKSDVTAAEQTRVEYAGDQGGRRRNC